MIIGIVGTRTRDSEADFALVADAFRSVYNAGDRIVSGGCPQGADRFAEIIAIELAKPAHYLLADLLDVKQFPITKRHHILKESGAPFILHHARWSEYGKAAGFQRNTLIARDADFLIAAVTRDRVGGTEDTIKKFLDKKPCSALYLV